jgi:hypothetical protein
MRLMMVVVVVTSITIYWPLYRNVHTIGLAIVNYLWASFVYE